MQDLTVITKLQKPPDLIKRIMDCVLILLSKPLITNITMTEITTGKNQLRIFLFALLTLLVCIFALYFCILFPPSSPSSQLRLHFPVLLGVCVRV
jgi:hypothetical protein